MQVIAIIGIILFAALLVFCLFLISKVYICDKETCDAFKNAKKKGEPGTKEYTIALLEEFCADGMWPLPYIAATVATPFALWFMGYPITAVNFAILFFTTFAIFYFTISFFIHHYMEFIMQSAIEFIKDDCIISENL